MSSPLSSPSDPLVTFHRLPARVPRVQSASIYTTDPPAHHVGGTNPPTSFRNPWPSFVNRGPLAAMHTRFLNRDRNFVPVPASREELVAIVEPDWGWGGRKGGSQEDGKESGEGGEREKDSDDNARRMKATWIGHASWLIETGVKRDAPLATPAITLTDDADEPVTTMLSPAERSSSQASASSASSTREDEEAEGDGGKKNAKGKEEERGIRILLDPVFSARMSPVRFAGPKRFSPPPCALEDLPDPVDLVVISHDHYDHLDAPTIRFLVGRERRRREEGAGKATGRGLLFLCGLGLGRHLLGMGVSEEEIVELDWWEGVRVQAKGVRGAVRLVCTPSQHNSGRNVWDMGKSLWCSWVIEELGLGDEDDVNSDDGRQRSSSGSGGNEPRAGRKDGQGKEEETAKQSTAVTGTNGASSNIVGSDSALSPSSNKKLFFAGDTAYRTIPSGADDKDRAAIAKLPRCPAFAEIGALYGPFDLALLPIGCYSPRTFMSHVHCAPDDAVCMHVDLRSRHSVAMHYGTVRGALSELYEDVREPPQLWRKEAERAGLKWGVEAGVCAIGETVLV